MSSGIITLGIGPKSSPSLFILYGLGAGDEAAPAEVEAAVGAGAAAQSYEIEQPAYVFSTAETLGMLAPKSQPKSPTSKPQLPKQPEPSAPKRPSLDEQISRGLLSEGALDARAFSRTARAALKATGLKANDPKVQRVLRTASSGSSGQAWASLDSMVRSSRREVSLANRKAAALKDRQAQKRALQKQQKADAKADVQLAKERKAAMQYAAKQRQLQKAEVESVAKAEAARVA